MYTLERIIAIRNIEDLTIYTAEGERYEVEGRKVIEFQIHEEGTYYELDAYESDNQWFPLNVYHSFEVNTPQVKKHHYTCPMCEKTVHIQAGFHRFSITPNECEGFLHILDELFQELLSFKSSMRLRMLLEFPNSVRE
jgi:hypothetical protein